ncbi:MAG: matrixin family metalloprotease [Betaproteobacteria bacterium]|nr:matrixin family metalloprotease [Betaproteobacteria bacterium]MCL2887199.1 matrixin family metalloprotease [Betaproteobacteria bacterium]
MQDYERKKLCPKGSFWRISDASPENSPLSTLISSAASAFTGFTDLPGTAVAQTTGTYNSGQIVLDTTAAGYTWYIDPTPFDNTDDYLPTADPNIWKAIPGSEAAGKMDLLSVLLHEYGHVLGLEHSGDPRNFMAATLQPGERRLPSAAEQQPMADLIAQIKTPQPRQRARGEKRPKAPHRRA